MKLSNIVVTFYIIINAILYMYTDYWMWSNTISQCQFNHTVDFVPAHNHALIKYKFHTSDYDISKNKCTEYINLIFYMYRFLLSKILKLFKVKKIEDGLNL